VILLVHLPPGVRNAHRLYRGRRLPPPIAGKMAASRKLINRATKPSRRRTEFMFQVAIFIELQPLSIFEFMFSSLRYAAAMPTATESAQPKSTLVVFASSKKWTIRSQVDGPLQGGTPNSRVLT
jgi:hypothetical protein